MPFRGILGKAAFADPRTGHGQERALIFQSKRVPIGSPAPPAGFLNSTRLICTETLHPLARSTNNLVPPHVGTVGCVVDTEARKTDPSHERASTCAPRQCRPGQGLPRHQVLVQSENTKKSSSGSSYAGLLGGFPGRPSARATLREPHGTSQWQVAISSHGLFSA